MNLIDLPNVMVMQIFEHLSYDEVAKKRLVCKKVDSVCQHILNCGFNKVVKQHAISLKRIKGLLPRRESERRNHCLARHADILTCIETRISMLSMTYSKYMDLNLCCFIPGRVLDEVFRILLLMTRTNKPLRPHEVLQELRDISSMAIEHFDEKIANTFKKSLESGNSMSTSVHGSNLIVNCYSGSRCGSPIRTTNSLRASGCCQSIRQRINSLNAFNQTLTSPLSLVNDVHISSSPSSSRTSANDAYATHEIRSCAEARTTMLHLKKIEVEYKKAITKIHRMQQVQNIQSRRLRQAMALLTELNLQSVEMKKRVEDVDAKNRELSATLKQMNFGSDLTVSPSSTGIEVPSIVDNESDLVVPLRKRRANDCIALPFLIEKKPKQNNVSLLQ